jgi:hypothetical protein
MTCHQPNARQTAHATRTTRLGKRGLGALTLLGGLATLSAANTANAQEFVLHVEPAAALWLDTPQSDRFTPGVYAALRPSIAFSSVVALQAGYALLWTPAGDGFEKDGTAHLMSVGLRLRPFGATGDPADQLGGLFVDGNVNYVRTGELDRFGFDAGLGYGFQVSPNFSLGPVVRYTQIVQANDDSAIDDNDAQLLTVGLSLSFGPAYTPPPKAEPCTQQSCPPVEPCVQEPPPPVVPPEPVPCACADGDADGVCDIDDRCPTLVGDKATFGCPVDPCTGRPLVMLVQFKYDSSKLPARKEGEPQTMDPVLDGVAAAIAKDSACRVCIIGHSSEEGSARYNQKLSGERARAVQGYLTGQGLAKNRMPTIGMGERCAIEPETSRLRNRRVEFYRLKEGESCNTQCASTP